MVDIVAGAYATSENFDHSRAAISRQETPYTLALFWSCPVRPTTEMLPAKDHDMIKAVPADCPVSLSASPFDTFANRRVTVSA
jgi:hypothetical protein